MKHCISALTGIFFALITTSHAAVVEVNSAKSRIQVDAKATGHQFCGDLRNYTIKVEGDATTQQPTRIELAWDFKDLKTADEKRDAAMLTWLGGGKPKGSFKFLKSWDESTTGGHAQGILSINGVEKIVAFNYTVTRDGSWVTLDGNVSLDYQNFNLPIIRTMAIMTVDPKLIIRFHLVGEVK